MSAAKALSDDPRIDVRLVEGTPRLGGLHKSVTLGGRVFDIGVFLFRPDHFLLRTFPFLLDSFVPAKPATVSITPAGHVDVYPVSLRGYVRDNGIACLLRSAVDIPYARLRYRSRATVEDYAKFYIGPTLFERSGLRHYIERLYGLELDQIGIDFALQRLHIFKAYLPAKAALRSLRARLPRRNAIDPKLRLVRPPEGFDAVYGAIEEDLVQRGVRVLKGARVDSLRRAGGHFIASIDGEEARYDAVISTIPIPAVFRLLGERPRARYDQMKLLSLFYSGRLANRAPIQTNFTRSGLWKRLIAFSSFYRRTEAADDYWVVEATTRDDSDETREALRDDFETHARSFGVVDGAPVLLGSEFTHNAYPVFRSAEAEALDEDRAALERIGVIPVGRQGRFEYLGSDQTSARAQRAARSIMVEPS